MYLKFYKCMTCGNVITKLTDSTMKVVCCGDVMEELKPFKTDFGSEKHVPIIRRKGNRVCVTVGSVEHPMTKEHYIQWIVLHTNQGVQWKQLSYDDEPKACFNIDDGDEVICAYEYCNLHGLWLSDRVADL